MKGTEKQIKWAEDIMRQARETISRNIENIDKVDTVGIRSLERQCFVECGEALEKAFSQIDSAAKIIEMRDQFSSERIVRMVNHAVFVKGNEK